MKEVKKRNGQIVEFEVHKITHAMRNAFASEHVAVSDEKLDEMTEAVVGELSARFVDQTPSVENVQDLVEFTLMREGYLSVAKHYIVYRYEHSKIREEKKQETIQKVEEKKLTIKTAGGHEEAFDADKVRASFVRVIKGYEKDIDVENVMSHLKYELYEGMTTDEVKRALISVVRSMIERDPAYSKVAAKLHLYRLYGEVFGTAFKEESLMDEHERVFVRNIQNAVTDGLLDPRMAEFDLAKLARKMQIENDSLFEYMGLEIMTSRYCMEDPKTKKTLETPQMLWMRIAMGLSLNEKKEDQERVAGNQLGVVGD
jgi:ribonucleoside-diphosphate reductase alpha chain